MGTSMTCSGIRTSSCRHTSTSWLSICGTGISSDGAKSTVSTICSTVCRWSLSCGPDAQRGGQAEPHRTNRSTPNPPWSWPSSGFVKRRSSRALHLCTQSGAGGCRQLRAHGHPLVSQPRAEPALRPPPCGARTMGAISTRAIRWVLKQNGAVVVVAVWC